MSLKARTFGYLLREACRGLSRNGLMAFAAASTITLSLLIMGVFLILVLNLSFLAERAEAQIELRIFLDAQITLPEIRQLRDEISGYHGDGVRKVSFISKEQAARDMEEALDVQDLFAGMEENPLPDALVIELARGAQVDKLVRRIRALPGVAEIVYRDFIRTVLLAAQIVWVVGMALILVISLGVLYIVVNTIRLTVFARRREIEIMKLVGATNWFVRWPFVLEGLILGLTGSAFAAVVLSKAYFFLFKSVSQLTVVPLVPEPRINGFLLLVLFPAGMFFGVIGSLLSVKKFLRE